jgi:hypothetical protein
VALRRSRRFDFLNKRRRLTRELSRITDEWVAEKGLASTFADMAVEKPDTARRFIELHVLLNLPVSDRVLDHYEMDPEQMRREYWDTSSSG